MLHLATGSSTIPAPALSGPFPAELATFPVLGTFSAHRHHRGPYTGAGSLLRYLVPGLLDGHQQLVTAHDVEIRAVAPEVRDVLPGTHEALTSQTGPEERTRFYPGACTLRVAHGLADLLLEVTDQKGPYSLIFTDVDEADLSDLQFMSVLWRRAAATRIELILVSASGAIPPELTVGPQAVEAWAPARQANPAGRSGGWREVPTSA